MESKLSKSAGWILILGGFLLLEAMGRLDLLLLLVPAAAILAYSITRLAGNKTNVTQGIK